MPTTQHAVVELLGDGISPELSASVRRAATALALPVRFAPIDLSHANREARGAEPLYAEAVAEIRRVRIAIKYPTETYRESPNAVLRDRLGLSVIHRPVATIPGIPTLFSRALDLHIVRVATGGTYEDAGRRVGSDAAVSIRVIEKRPCAEAAQFAFGLASRLRAGVVSTSKWTIQEAADGLFHEAVDEVAKRHPGVPHRRELFDALLARLVMRPEDYRVIVTPNEYGDFLSDLACGLIGSMGLGDSASYSFREDGEVDCAIFDPAGGTAPDIAGKDLANPSAALFALATCLRHLGEERPASALRRAVIDAIGAGERTRDLGGRLGTTAFADAVVRRAADLLALHPVGG